MQKLLDYRAALVLHALTNYTPHEYRKRKQCDLSFLELVFIKSDRPPDKRLEALQMFP